MVDARLTDGSRVNAIIPPLALDGPAMSIRRFGQNPRVVALQVTNEANFIPFSPDSSDSAFRGVRDALIQGVEAAKDESERLGYSQLRIGFNWVYRNDPQSEASFWDYLHDHGGASFVRAVDWVGLDAYPGTVFPPTEPPGGHRDGMVAAISQLRKCFMPIAGLGDSVPIHVEENGWPTSPPARSYEQQSDVLDAMVRAVHDFRGTYNVSDYRWFDLRDHNSGSSNFQAQYGLLRDDYTPKPAFDRYRRDVADLALRWPGAARLSLRLRYHVGVRRDSGGGLRRRCAASKPLAKLRGADLGSVVRADFSARGRLLAVRGAAPFVKRIALKGVRSGRAFKVVAVAVLDDDRVVTLERRLRRC